MVLQTTLQLVFVNVTQIIVWINWSTLKLWLKMYIYIHIYINSNESKYMYIIFLILIKKKGENHFWNVLKTLQKVKQKNEYS